MLFLRTRALLVEVADDHIALDLGERRVARIELDDSGRVLIEMASRPVVPTEQEPQP